MSKAAALFYVCLFAVGTARADELPPPRDPMQPFTTGPAAVGGVALPRFHLTAVLISSTRRVAIVNGKPYLHGERVDGAEIIRIEPDAVHLHDRGEDLVIPLGQPVAGRPSIRQGDAAP